MMKQTYTKTNEGKGVKSVNESRAIRWFDPPPGAPRSRHRKRGGRCYEIAYDTIMNQPQNTEWTLVHGIAAGIDHAWLENERQGLMWEPQLNACATLDEWRRHVVCLGRWNQREAAHTLLDHDHLGPWINDKATDVDRDVAVD